jgi:hypothetical protein
MTTKNVRKQYPYTIADLAAEVGMNAPSFGVWKAKNNKKLRRVKNGETTDPTHSRRQFFNEAYLARVRELRANSPRAKKAAAIAKTVTIYTTAVPNKDTNTFATIAKHFGWVAKETSPAKKGRKTTTNAN